MRKDVKCVFGILKGHFHVLKTGIRVHEIRSADRIWLTCCALHNFLLHADGLNKRWMHGVATDCEGEHGDVRDGDLPPHL